MLPGGYVCPNCLMENACDCKVCGPASSPLRRVIREGPEGFRCAYCGVVSHLDATIEAEELMIDLRNHS